MRLSWNEIKARAARFADEWRNAHYERGESQTFYNEFFEVFGVTRRRVASFFPGLKEHELPRVLVAERPLLHAENEAELLYKLGQLAKVKPD